MMTEPTSIALSLPGTGSPALRQVSLQSVDTPRDIAAPAGVDSPELWLTQARAGDRDAFGRIVEHHHARLFNYLCQLTRNRHDAEDLTQDTFVKAWRNLHRFDPQYAFVNWLFTIAKRNAASHWRAVKPSEPVDENLAEDRESPASEMARRDEQETLWDIARRMKPKQFEVLWLRYGEGFSVTEVAQVMNSNSLYVKVLLHRARNELLRRLQGRESLVAGLKQVSQEL